MYEFFTACSDVLVILFDLLFYTKLTPLKKDTPLIRGLMYSTCLLITLAYLVAISVFHVPAALSSLLIMSIPSLLVFWLLSRYKDARFFVTFCLVDTLSLIIAFFSRALAYYWEPYGAAAGAGMVLVLFLCLYFFGRPRLSHYRQLLESVPEGWNAMMLSGILIYILLVLFASYPTPMVQRPEYIPSYLLLTVVIFSFYWVFISSLVQKKGLNELNGRLLNEKKWHDIAYVDGLTKMKNRMAYMERVNELSRAEGEEKPSFVVISDLDDFKHINDSLGHHHGDLMLQKAASRFLDIFSAENYETFRIGGDEFTAIATAVDQAELEEKLAALNQGESLGVCFSYGWAPVNWAEPNAIEMAFIRADAAMYQHKGSKKPALQDN